jgi:hypothetical protein
MKEIFSGKTFWAILVILLLAVFVYPPWLGHFTDLMEDKICPYRYWNWIFNWKDELDLKMILAESIIAILVSVGICLIFFHKRGKKKE